MSVVAVCPKCDAKYTLKDAAVGRKMKCRQWEKPFRLTAAIDEFDTGSDDEFDRPARSRSKQKRQKKAPLGEGEVRVTCGDCSARFEVAIRQKAYETRCIVCDQPVPVPGQGGSGKSSAKKSGKRKKSRKMPKFLIPLAIGVAVIGVVVGLAFLLPNTGPGESGIKAPAAYEVYADNRGNQFHVEYPDGWKIEAGARGTSNPWARFKKGSATIRVKTSMGASAMGDIMGMGGDDEDTPDELTAVAQVHTFMKKQYADEYSDYEEQPAKMIKTGMGDGQLSEFTAAGGWGSKTKGVRLTCLATNYQFTVLCDCSESDWAACKPIFERVAKSLSH
ncbi:MAG: hypothetical protein HON53_17095 [Planctomycetaceae bacterium]|nr:hypothetical protein [Planctomycetaceae bacterium]